MNPVSQDKPARGVLYKILLVGPALAGLVFILWLDRWMVAHDQLPDLTGEANVGLLILMGLMTSVHCVGMCGPLVFGYAAHGAGSGRPGYGGHLLYGLGKTLSYTMLGAAFGEFGAMVAFTPFSKGIAGILAGLFLMLFGLHMLEVFRALDHFQLRTPSFVMRFIGKAYRRHGNPFVIGLLNGLMIICGPLQAMYVMAAGSGSWSAGATILLFFGLGTLPLMLGFGILTSVVSHNLGAGIMRFSGVIVIALGIVMLNHGLLVTGSGLDLNTLQARIVRAVSPPSGNGDCCGQAQTINMTVTRAGFEPNSFTLRQAVPVTWVIDVKELTDCNKVIVVPAYGLNIALHSGRQTVTFTPGESGVVPWSCWMGMMPGSFDVQASSGADQAKPSDAGTRQWLTLPQRLLDRLRQLWRDAVTATPDAEGRA